MERKERRHHTREFKLEAVHALLGKLSTRTMKLFARRGVLVEEIDPPGRSFMLVPCRYW